MDLIISNNSNKPIYEQISSQIISLIMSGDLSPGDSLPSMRSLAKSLQISVITVQRAYEDLQESGFIESRVGLGSFVSHKNKEFWREENLKLAEEHLKKAAMIGKKYDIKLEELKNILEIFYIGDE